MWVGDVQTSHGYPMLVSRTGDRYRKAHAGRAWAGMLGHQPWVSHVDGRAYAGLTGIVLEAALDSSFLYGCFGFLMGQGHILTEANHHAHQGGAFVR